MIRFEEGDRVRCVAPAPLGAPDQVGRLFTVLERAASGHIRIDRHGPFCHPSRFDLVRRAAAAATAGERAEEMVVWFAACAGRELPPVARASCLRGMRAVMEAAFGRTFQADDSGRVAFGPLA
jgi:hypothetical protein